MAVRADLLERWVHVDAHRLQSGGETGNAGHERGSAREGEHAPVGCHREHDLSAGDKQHEQPGTEPARHREADPSTERGKHQALGEELTHEASAAGTDREANRNLPLPRRRPCEQQRRQVHAGQHQDEPDDPHQDEKRLRDVVANRIEAVGR